MKEPFLRRQKLAVLAFGEVVMYGSFFQSLSCLTSLRSHGIAEHNRTCVWIYCRFYRYKIEFIILLYKRCFSFSTMAPNILKHSALKYENNLKDLHPSYKTDQEVYFCFGRENPPFSNQRNTVQCALHVQSAFIMASDCIS